MVEAHEIEETVALYPRVVVSDGVIPNWRRHLPRTTRGYGAMTMGAGISTISPG